MHNWEWAGVFCGIFSLVLALSSCTPNKSTQSSCSSRLQEIVVADQDARKDFKLTLHIMAHRQQAIAFMQADILRAKEIIQLISTGCIKTSEDNLNAALVLLHGGATRYYHDAYVCAKKALDMGALEAKGILALAYDRYLLSINKKQVFGSQAVINKQSSCFCIPNLQLRFSDKLRKKQSGYTLHERINLYKRNMGMNMCANCKI